MYIILHSCVREISGCPEDQLLPRFGALCSWQGFVQPPAVDPVGPCLSGHQRVQHAHAGMALCAARPASTHVPLPYVGLYSHAHVANSTRACCYLLLNEPHAASFKTVHAHCSSSKVNRRTGELSHVLYIKHVTES